MRHKKASTIYVVQMIEYVPTAVINGERNANILAMPAIALTINNIGVLKAFRGRYSVDDTKIIPIDNRRTPKTKYGAAVYPNNK